MKKEEKRIFVGYERENHGGAKSNKTNKNVTMNEMKSTFGKINHLY